MIENIVRRAKKLAIKRVIAGGAEGRVHRRPARLHQAGVQGARGPAEHHEPRRLGEDLGQEGRADCRVHPAPLGQGPGPDREVRWSRDRAAWRPASTCDQHRRRVGSDVGSDVVSGVRPMVTPSGTTGTAGVTMASVPAIGSLGSPAMAIPKVCGIETEYGIHRARRGRTTLSPRRRCSINAYVAAHTRQRKSRIGWDFEDERPGNDARGLQPRRRLRRPRSRRTSSTPCSPTAPATTSTTPTPRSARPSATTAREAVQSTTGRPRRSCGRSMEAARELLPDGAEILSSYKNNSDGKGNSYGCHENYLVSARDAVRSHRRPDHALTS